ncbi:MULTISPECIES: sigma-E factor negative regulatory protein [Methylobacter]|uniref:sigma-E factor negative regulatory protein n=1 Tax=Methylobacter TaxID=429 RepID=UPI001FAC8F47|nr:MULTISPECIES: sigma-E factor negative regulatory protein [Methylobacter]UOA08001.1 sigma-E factor negative regulatory protein [Methylobacter sp. S3L5C]
MPEDLNLKISQFLDNELDQVDALSCLKRMQSRPELKDKLRRYEMISHAMKKDAFLLIKADFSTKIHQQIQQEPVYFLPQHKSFKRSHKQIAVAASLVIVAVIAGRSINISNQSVNAVTALQVAQNKPHQQPDKPVEATQYPLNKQINDYLQAHNNSVYTNGEADFQPYARVTASSRPSENRKPIAEKPVRSDFPLIFVK